MSATAQYLGDSVYADTDGFGSLVLTTDSHKQSEAGNVIVLEPSVLRRLTEYIAKAQAERRLP